VSINLKGNEKNRHDGNMELGLGGAQSRCRTDYVNRYLGDMGVAHTFLIQKHELIKNHSSFSVLP
jgi:hypothetical protein